MAKITLTYPNTWLIISIIIKNRLTWITDLTWTMTEISPGIYKYDFLEVADIDYIYTATTPWYDNISWVIYRDKVIDNEAIADAIWNNPTRDLTFYAWWWWYDNNEALSKFLKKRLEEIEDKIESTDTSKIEENIKYIENKIDNIEVINEDDKIIKKLDILDKYIKWYIESNKKKEKQEKIEEEQFLNNIFKDIKQDLVDEKEILNIFKEIKEELDIKDIITNI